MTVYIGNAFSLQMIHHKKYYLGVENVSKQEFDAIKQKGVSIIGHQPFAEWLGVEYNRESIQLIPGDILYVAQIVSGRLPENVHEVDPNTIKVGYKKVRICD